MTYIPFDDLRALQAVVEHRDFIVEMLDEQTPKVNKNLAIMDADGFVDDMIGEQISRIASETMIACDDPGTVVALQTLRNNHLVGDGIALNEAIAKFLEPSAVHIPIKGPKKAYEDPHDMRALASFIEAGEKLYCSGRLDDTDPVFQAFMTQAWTIAERTFFDIAQSGVVAVDEVRVWSALYLRLKAGTIAIFDLPGEIRNVIDGLEQ